MVIEYKDSFNMATANSIALYYLTEELAFPFLLLGYRR